MRANGIATMERLHGACNLVGLKVWLNRNLEVRWMACFGRTWTVYSLELEALTARFGH